MFNKTMFILVFSISIISSSKSHCDDLNTVEILKQAISPALYGGGGIITAYLAYKNAQCINTTADTSVQEMLATNAMAFTIASGFCIYKSLSGCAHIAFDKAPVSTHVNSYVQKNGNIATTASFAIEL